MGLALPLLVLASACGGERAVVPATSPRRIIAIAPAVAEMLFELDLGERVVGVGSYVQWPPEAARKPRVGGLFDARLEAIARLEPDLAVLLPSEDNLRYQLEKLGVEVLTVRTETVADVERMAVQIATRCGVSERGQAFAADWRMKLAPRPVGRPVRVLLSVTREPGRLSDILVGGPGTFLDELLTLLGVDNVMADSPLAYPQVGLEEILARRPEVIIELQPAPGTYERLVVDWRNLIAASPLAETCIEVVAGEHVLIPGPRLPRLYRELREAVLACGGGV